MDHLPTNFDIAFRRATESMMTEPKEQQDGVLDQEEESRTAEQELKHTSKRGGTDGSPMIDEQYTR
jgi:hypothetical protein